MKLEALNAFWAFLNKQAHLDEDYKQSLKLKVRAILNKAEKGKSRATYLQLIFSDLWALHIDIICVPD